MNSIENRQKAEILCKYFSFCFIFLFLGVINIYGTGTRLLKSENIISAWNGGLKTGLGSEPNKFGWACTKINQDGWTQSGSGSVRYMDNLSYLPSGRLMFVRWDGSGGTDRSSVYSYPVQLKENKTYIFSIKYTYHSNTITDFIIGINTNPDNSGINLVTGTFSPAEQSFKEARFKFISTENKTGYVTIAASASGMLGSIADLQIIESPAILESNTSSVQLNYFEEEKKITIFPNGSQNAINLIGVEGIKISPNVLPSCGGTVVISSDNHMDIKGKIQVKQGDDQVQIAVLTDFPKDFLPTQKIDTMTTNGAWCWFADPRAIYHKGQKEQTYFSWITTEGDIIVASYNHVTKEYKQHTIWEKFQTDDHANPSLLIRDDGRIIIFIAAHFGDKIKRFISTNSEDITSWGEKYEFAQTVTYPYPFRVNNDIYVFYRGGSSWHPHLTVSTDNGLTFSESKLFISGGGQRPYARYFQGSDGSIHVAVTTGHPRNEINNKIHYCRFKDNKFYRADGTFIKDFAANGAIDINQLEVVYNANVGKGWIWDIMLEPVSGYPILVYASFPTDLEHHYRYARWNGSSWDNTEITKAGKWFPQTPEGTVEPEPNYSGGIILDYDDPSVLYLSKEVKGVFEIFKYTTSDHGKTWVEKALTWNTPSNLLNVRPIVPRHHKIGYFDVIWMRGTYVFYGAEKYNTALVFPSNSEKVSLSAINLNISEITLMEGESKQILANRFPAFAAEERIFWESSNTGVAMVENGMVTAISSGKATIKAFTQNGISTTCEMTVKKPVLLSNVLFDFGTVDSPLLLGSIGITESTLINNSYGWLSTVVSRNRNVGDDELRDFNMGSSPAIFKVYLEKGEYKVTIKQGDYEFPHDYMNLKVNNEIKLSNISHSKGAFNIATFNVTVNEKYLEFEFSDGGGDANWVVNSILIEKQKPGDINAEFASSVFENPATVIKIYDLSSRMIGKGTLGNSDLADFISKYDLDDGIYLVSLILNNNKKTFKYIRNTK